MLILMVLILGLVPAVSFAAYQDPTIISNDGKQIVFQFSGDAGEDIKTMTYVVQSSTTQKAVREWVKDTIDELNGIRSAATLPALQPGQTVARLNRTAAARAAKETWNDKLARYLYVKDSGLAASAAELAAMKTDLETTYQAGFLAP